MKWAQILVSVLCTSLLQTSKKSTNINMINLQQTKSDLKAVDRCVHDAQRIIDSATT
ncbi:hypothetical protein Hanom_Chr14g01334061 [Helianthus anomalus]